MPRSSLPLACTRTTKRFSPCMPDMTKESAASVECSTVRWRTFFSSSNSAGSAASRRRNVSMSICPLPEVQRLPVRANTDFGTKVLGRPRRAPVIKSSMMRQPTDLSAASDGGLMFSTGPSGSSLSLAACAAAAGFFAVSLAGAVFGAAGAASFAADG